MTLFVRSIQLIERFYDPLAGKIYVSRGGSVFVLVWLTVRYPRSLMTNSSRTLTFKSTGNKSRWFPRNRYAVPLAVCLGY